MNENLTIYLCGNPLLPFDSLPLKFKSRLERAFPNICFKELDPNENLKPINKELVIIDTIEGIDEVKIITDIDQIQVTRLYSMHDFDLGFNLKLLKKIGALEKITIFGVPMKGDEEKILSQLITELSSVIPN